jgi:UDP-glucose 4-epimerase
MNIQKEEKAYMTDTAVVTGGAGFIGANLIKRLVQDGYSVISIDNYSNGTVERHIDSPHVTYKKGHARDINSLVEVQPKYIFHFGEYARVEQSFDELEKVFDYNSALPYVCQFAKATGAKLIYAGSSTKFAHEGIISPYAFSKAQNTEFIVNYAKWYGLDYAIAYFYNVYGPMETSVGKYATVIAKFLELARKNEPITITSPGHQARNFTHIEDIVDGLMLIADKGCGDELGIGHDKAWSILEVAKMLTDNIIMTPEKKGNRLSANVCNSKLKDLGWNPKHDLQTYLQAELNML